MGQRKKKAKRGCNNYKTDERLKGMGESKAWLNRAFYQSVTWGKKGNLSGKKKSKSCVSHIV